MIEIEMKLFGVFRKYQNQQNPILFTFTAPASVDQVKNALSKCLIENFSDFGKNGEQLIMDSAIANESEILVQDAMIHQSCSLSILPPVCGG